MKTEQEIESALKIVKAVAGAIKELGTVPSGHLYARLIELLSLDQYNQVITVLKRSGLIEENHHMLKWIA